MNCRELSKCAVFGSLGEKIGRIGDMTFTFDGELKLSQFILAGSRIEELLESMKFKPDKDPLFDASIIRRIGDKVVLSTEVNSLKTTLDPGAIPKGEIRWSELQKKDIIDKDEVKVGRAVDIEFELDGTASLIVGGGMIEETLEAIGLKADIDIIVPVEFIDKMDDKVKLNVTKDVLKLTMDEALNSERVRKLRDSKSSHPGVLKVHLHHIKP
jgi:sporulation protein YlmC with PRC-barrel domain